MGAYAEELSRYPAAVEPLNRLVALLQGQGKLQEAFEVIDNTVARRPETADDAPQLAELHQLRGQLREAEEALRRALALAPD
ncbi:MAG: hypothetical protein VKM17_04760, partial [Cyanobacteriota bacterium]|nr:hypothetical protein [Cyanobacteriota bacterium]